MYICISWMRTCIAIDLFDGGGEEKFPVQWKVVGLNISINDCLAYSNDKWNEFDPFCFN